jgi:hypothetical protein
MSQLPLEKSDLPIVGWRAWESLYPGFLKSMNSKSLWPPMEKMVASTDGNNGLYAYKTEELLSDNYALGNIFNRFVWGQVYLWGRVIEHEDGYRAEFGYPKVLFYSFLLNYEGIERYGVPFEKREVPVRKIDEWTHGYVPMQNPFGTFGNLNLWPQPNYKILYPNVAIPDETDNIVKPYTDLVKDDSYYMDLLKKMVIGPQGGYKWTDG